MKITSLSPPRRTATQDHALNSLTLIMLSTYRHLLVLDLQPVVCLYLVLVLVQAIQRTRTIL